MYHITRGFEEIESSSTATATLKEPQLHMLARSHTLIKIVSHNIQFVLTHNRYATRGEEIIKVVKGGDVGLCKYNTVASQVS